MKGLAHIHHEGGGFIVPAQTPYERQLLFEHLERSTRRHGVSELAFDRCRWTVSRRDGGSEACDTCEDGLHGFAYGFEGRTHCGQCARRALD